MTPDEQRDDQPDSANAAWSIVSYLLSGMAVWGGAGWLLDRWAGLDAVFFPIGLIVGIAAALYIVYVRFGRS
jgi:F0F1-type ATP synthase assembly protein I